MSITRRTEEPLPIGTQNGCFTVIAGFEAYQEERAKDKIAKLEEEKQKFINGETSSWHNFTAVESFDLCISQERETKLYKVQCKCGKCYFHSADFLFFKKWRDCGEECGIRAKKEAEMIASYPRIESPSYNIEFINGTHESLSILECLDDHVEGKPQVYDRRKKGGGRVYLYKKYRCKCYLCGKEYEFLSSDFVIGQDAYGSTASWGYYSNARCGCHNVSSFQWRTIAILAAHKVPYKVEVSFPDLLSEKGNPLRYDFLIFNPDGSHKCLIECQGKQHFEIGNGYGGYASLNARQARDAQKRNYAQKINIPLIEISYKYDTYDKEEAFLREIGVL